LFHLTENSEEPRTDMKLRIQQQHWPILLGLVGSFALVAATTAAPVPDQNWPQWRGPLQNGVAPTANPPTAWSETNNVKWKVRIPGSGQATPIIWDNWVFLQTAIPTGKKTEAKPAEASEQPPRPRPEPGGEPPRTGPGGPSAMGGKKGPGGFGPGPRPTEVYQFAVLCLDRQTGKVLWQQVAREEVPHEGYREGEGSFASASGLTDGEHLYAYFGSRGLYCYDFDGKPVWDQDLGRMRMAMGFGEGSSPTLYQDTLIVNRDNEDSSCIIALDKNTGKTLWKKPREEHTSWSTPLIIERDGKAQAVVTATGKIRSYDVASGDVLWECGGLTRNVIPCPVADTGMVYCMSGFQGNALLAIRLGRTGDLTGSDAIAWTHNKSTPYVPSPLLYNGKLYFFANNNGVLTCLETKSGEPLFEAQKLEDLAGVYASPLGAAGRVYLISRNGVTVVLKQSDKLEVLATNRLEEKLDASPAAVGNDLFLRGHDYLYCITEK
jgi:outer membrane protein assembly factor BamB